MPYYENTPERQVAIECFKSIRVSTCQIFIFENGKLKPHGCSVLLTCSSKYYVLSNSHVLNKLKFTKVFFLDSMCTPILLEGDLFFSEPIIGETKRDTYDTATMRISFELANELMSNGYQFLELEKAETNVVLLRESVTMIAAYPANTTKLKLSKKQLKFNPLIVRTIPTIKDYQFIDFPSAFHHIVEYPRKSFIETSTKQRRIAPKPHGMSGSGLWILAGESHLNHRPYLIGILSEYDKNRSLIFSTKIDIYISIMQQVFDEKIPYKGIKVQLDIIK
jgi:hypothetical protein